MKDTLANGTVEQRVDRFAKLVRDGFDPLIASAIALYKRQSAPPNPADGWLWYRQDTRRFQARQALTTLDVPLVLARDTSVATVTNTTTETAIASTTIPANMLSTDRVVRLTILGRYLNNSGATDTIRFEAGYGGTGWIDTSAAIAASANQRVVRMTVWMAPANSTSAQRLFGELTIGTAGGATGGLGDLAAAVFADTVFFRAPAIDSTADQTLEVTVQHTTANANITYTQDFYVVEVL